MPNRRAAIAAALLAFTAALGVAGADEAPATPQPAPTDLIGTRWIAIASPYTTPRHNFELIFTHRFQEAVQDGSSHDLWGLDSGAAVGFGLAWGLTDRLEVSLYRVNLQEDFELALKAMLLRQDDRVPLSAALRIGLDRPRAPDIADRNRPFAQLVLGRHFAPGWNLMVAPSWIRDTATLRNAWNVPFGITAPLPHDALLALEIVPKNRDADSAAARFEGAGAHRELAWSVALVKDFGRHITGGHLFKITVGNSPATTLDQMLGSDPARHFRLRDVRIGFNLVRDFQL